MPLIMNQILLSGLTGSTASRTRAQMWFKEEQSKTVRPICLVNTLLKNSVIGLFVDSSSNYNNHFRVFFFSIVFTVGFSGNSEITIALR